MENNAYFEQQKAAYYGNLEEENLVLKIKECSTVLEELEKSNAWGIFLNSAREKETFIDSNWHLAQKEMLESFRVKKTALKLITNFKDEFISELKYCQEELEKRKNVGTEVNKDYDPE